MSELEGNLLEITQFVKQKLKKNEKVNRDSETCGIASDI